MKRRDRPGVVDLDRRRRDAKKKPAQRTLEWSAWTAWALLLAAAVVWALVRMAGA